MKAVFLYIILMAVAANGFSQKQSFHVVSYAQPKGWVKRQGTADPVLRLLFEKKRGLKLKHR